MKDEQWLAFLKQNYPVILGKKLEGIIHNLNSPLNNVMGYALLAKQKFPNCKEAEKILAASNKINEMLKDLSQILERYKSSKRQLISLDELIHHELELLEHSLFFKHKVEIEYQSTENISKIWLVYSDIAFVFSELLTFSQSILEKEKKKKICIFTREDEENISLQIEIDKTSDESIHELTSPKYERLLGIISLLLSDYKGSFHHRESNGKILFTVKLPKGVNQCLE